jgi:hypothetical protein
MCSAALRAHLSESVDKQPEKAFVTSRWLYSLTEEVSLVIETDVDDDELDDDVALPPSEDDEDDELLVSVRDVELPMFGGVLTFSDSSLGPSSRGVYSLYACDAANL